MINEKNYIVNGNTKKQLPNNIRYLLISLLILSIIDGVLTIIAVNNFRTELHPLYAYILEFSYLWFLYIKVFLTFCVIWVLRYLYIINNQYIPRKTVKDICFMLVIIFGYICLNNLYWVSK